MRLRERQAASLSQLFSPMPARRSRACCVVPANNRRGTFSLTRLETQECRWRIINDRLCYGNRTGVSEDSRSMVHCAICTTKAQEEYEAFPCFDAHVDLRCCCRGLSKQTVPFDILQTKYRPEQLGNREYRKRSSSRETTRLADGIADVAIRGRLDKRAARCLGAFRNKRRQTQIPPQLSRGSAFLNPTESVRSVWV